MNEQILDCINRSKYLAYLRSIGVDDDVVEEAIANSVDEEELQLFVNSSHKLLSPNIYIESVVFQHACKYLYENYEDSAIISNEAKLDIKTIIAAANSLVQRPNSPKPSETVRGFKKPIEKDGFLIISRFERELTITDRYGTRKPVKILSEGLLPTDIEVDPLYSNGQTIDIWDNNYCFGQPFIQGFNGNVNSIEAHFVLWLNCELLDILGLRLDHYSKGLRALNSNDEVVLRFRCWREQLIGVGMDSNIAKLEGCDLTLRKDYFKSLKRVVPNLVFYTEFL